MCDSCNGRMKLLFLTYCYYWFVVRTNALSVSKFPPTTIDRIVKWFLCSAHMFVHCWFLFFFSFLVELLKQNVDVAAENLQAEGIEVLEVVCHVSNAQQRKNLIDKTVQERFILISYAIYTDSVWALISYLKHQHFLMSKHYSLTI